MSLSEFDFTIVHRKGKANTNADVASRWTKYNDWDPFPYYADPVATLEDSNTSSPNKPLDNCQQCLLVCQELKSTIRTHPHSVLLVSKIARPNLDESEHTTIMGSIHRDMLNMEMQGSEQVNLRAELKKLRVNLLCF